MAIQQELSRFIPSIDTGTVTTALIYIGVGILVVIGLAVFMYFYMNKKRFNKKFHIFRSINGKPVWIETVAVAFERVGMAGDYWAKTIKGKITPRPKMEIRKNEYFMFEKEDGEYINFEMNDINEELKKSNSKFIDEDMRLSRISIQKILKERLDKKSWWDTYGQYVFTAVLGIVLVVSVVIVFNKLGDVLTALEPLVGAINEVAKTLNDGLIRQQSGIVLSNYTGIKPI